MVRVTANTKPYPPKDTGRFQDAWKTEALRESHTVKLDVYNPTPYAAIIEYGRRPGKFPWPINPLEKWVERKFGIKDEAEKRAVAFAVGRKIKQRGIPGKHLLENAIPDLERLIVEEIKSVLDKLIDKGHA